MERKYPDRFRKLEREEILRQIPDRKSQANKGTYGKVLVAAGSRGMGGAAFFAGLAAYRAGAGLVKLFTHEENREILQMLLPEALFEGYGEDAEEELRKRVERSLQWCDACVLGPGLGRKVSSRQLLRSVLSLLAAPLDPEDKSRALEKDRPGMLLLDADALNIASEDPASLERIGRIARERPVIVTPHPLEMARLLHADPVEVIADPLAACGRFTRLYRTITVMKGAQTCAAMPCDAEDAERILLFRNTEPSPALAKGGSGDVLSGCIAGIYEILKADGAAIDAPLPAAFRTAFTAASAGILVHAEAGRQAAEKYGVHGVLARETADEIGRVLDIFYRQRKNACQEA